MQSARRGPLDKSKWDERSMTDDEIEIIIQHYLSTVKKVESRHRRQMEKMRDRMRKEKFAYIKGSQDALRKPDLYPDDYDPGQGSSSVSSSTGSSSGVSFPPTRRQPSEDDFKKRWTILVDRLPFSNDKVIALFCEYVSTGIKNSSFADFLLFKFKEINDLSGFVRTLNFRYGDSSWSLPQVELGLPNDYSFATCGDNGRYKRSTDHRRDHVYKLTNENNFLDFDSLLDAFEQYQRIPKSKTETFIRFVTCIFQPEETDPCIIQQELVSVDAENTVPAYTYENVNNVDSTVHTMLLNRCGFSSDWYPLTPR